MIPLQKIIIAFKSRDYSGLTLADLRELVAHRLLHPKTAARIAAKI